ncbi:MAG: asparaginase domain-containing protein, partial [Cutibacterium granulosum]|nr:asparaginase domain-containing protein [Cutibacterium granulosum]
MRISVLYTGGTIGMVETPQGLAPGADLQGWLTDLLAGTGLAGQVVVTTMEPLVDSSNVTPLLWQRIVDQIRRDDESDGFVVLHGTDTMAYTSAALSYALTDLDRPVVVTGSQLPLGTLNSDADANVMGALEAASSGRLHSVAVFFDHELLDGARVTKASSYDLRAFTSPNVPL